jgi:hypothetical protein
MANSFEIVVLGGPALEARPLSNAAGMSTEPLEPAGTLVVRLERQFRELGSTPGRVTLAPVARAGDALGDALAGSRTLGREDRTALHWGCYPWGVLLVAGFAATFPALVGWVVALVGAWLGVTTGIRAYVQVRKAHAEEHAARLLSGVKGEEGERAEVAADSTELESEHGSP